MLLFLIIIVLTVIIFSVNYAKSLWFCPGACMERGRTRLHGVVNKIPIEETLFLGHSDFYETMECW